MTVVVGYVSIQMEQVPILATDLFARDIPMCKVRVLLELLALPKQLKQLELREPLAPLELLELLEPPEPLVPLEPLVVSFASMRHVVKPIKTRTQPLELDSFNSILTALMVDQVALTTVGVSFVSIRLELDQILEMIPFVTDLSQALVQLEPPELLAHLEQQEQREPQELPVLRALLELLEVLEPLV